MSRIAQSRTNIIFRLSHHGLLLVLVIWVPPDAHDHLVDGAVVHLGPPEVDPGLGLGGEALHNLSGEVG